jgi:hypothetical protein
MKNVKLTICLLVMSILASLLYPAVSVNAEQSGGTNLPQIVNSAGYYQNYFLVPENFAADLGTWTIAPYFDSLRGNTLYGKTDGNVGAARPANATIQITEGGTYYVWAHSREFDTQPGKRQFKLKVGGQTMSHPFGAQTSSGWLWETGGPVQLNAGATNLSVLDSSANNPRVDAILLTTDPHFVPDANYNVLKNALSTPRPVVAESNIFLRPESFNDLGTWSVEAYAGSLGGFNLIGLKSPDGTIFDPTTAKPAVAHIQVPDTRTYKVWVRSKNFIVSQIRFFGVQVNDKLLAKSFGKLLTNDWVWEDGGTVELQQGENTLQLIDASGFYGRTDGIFLTTDMNLVPPAAYEEILKIAPSKYVYEDRTKYPEWAKSDAVPSQTNVLQNDHVRVEFYTVSTPQGDVVQKRTFIKRDGNDVPVESRTDGFGYLLMYGDSANIPNLSDVSPIIDATVGSGGDERRVVSLNTFHGGYPSWMIPSQVITAETGKIVLAAENDLAQLEAEWSLPADGLEPVVKLTLHAKRNGAFSIGMFNGVERPLGDIDYLLNPLRFQGKRLPVDPALVTEQVSSSASSYMTMHGHSDIANGMEVTYAIAVDSASITNQWAYKDNARFGLGIMGQNRGVQPSLFAPVMGMPDSHLNAGSKFVFTYRPVTMLDGWYNTYNHVTNQILGLHDYRKNVEASLTDTIFNVQDLMMNDDFGGWDATMKAYYNMEAQNVVSSSSPLAVLQSYMLTEDKDIYERRVVPTLEYMLTRKSIHFSSTGNTISSPALKFPKPAPIGAPVVGYGTSVFGGLFDMTKGLTSVFRKIGIDGGGLTKGNGNVPSWAESAWMYRFTGDTTYLNTAKAGADLYLSSTVYKVPTNAAPLDSFYLLSYLPNFNALLDLYEISGEQKYLDAAVYTARQLITGFRTYPTPGGQMTINADDIRAKSLTNNPLFYWKGDHTDRLGYPEGLNDLQNETVPAWIPSPVGLGIEQGITFLGTKSGFIDMSNWAPDLTRLTELTGDQTFEMFARNAVLGRGANYPGYYQNQFMTLQTKADYPYTGPDLTSIYYHHIPVYYSILTDFLMSQVWSWSNKGIDFPFLRQQGYAYFNNRTFGSESGKFFDQQDMWLWLKRGLITTGNMQVDWLAARKDGVFAAALMNEDTVAITTTVQFGEELGGDKLKGTATLYDANGNQSAAVVSEGKVTVTVPAHGLIGIVMNNPRVKAPGFAAIDSADSLMRSIGETAAEPTQATDFGYGNVLQIDPSFYHAYTYTTDMADVTDHVVLHYRIGDGSWQQAETATYPYEFTIKVEDAAAPFHFYMDVYKKDGTVKTSLEKTLRAYSAERAITGFQVNGQIADPIILPQLHTVTAFVYGNTDVTQLVPNVTVSDKATLVSPTGNVDFTQPVKYTIRAENGLTETWTVIVVPINGWESVFQLIDRMKHLGWLKNDNSLSAGLMKSLDERNTVSIMNQLDGLLKGNQITPEASAIIQRAMSLVK